MRVPWIWWGVPERGIRRAELDYRSYPAKDYPAFGSKRVPEGALGLPVFSTPTLPTKFVERHSPPTDGSFLVDHTLQRLIISIVDPASVQFHPVLIRAGGVELHGYFWLFALACVDCIDFGHDGIRSIGEFSDGSPYVREADSFRYRPACIGSHHIARDSGLSSHLVVSDALKRALEATGEPFDFRLPHEVTEPRYRCRPLD